MKLFGWFKNDPESKGLVKGRAVAIPHYPRVESRSNVVENTSGPDAVSTLSVTLRLLKDGESAAEVGSQYPRLAPTGMHKTTNTPDGCQRLHVNVPNWVHLMVRQEGYVHKEHTEVPVWINPNTGKLDRIDKEKLLEELEPDRERARHIYKVAGIFGKMPDSAEPARETSSVMSVDEDFEDIEDVFDPDMTQYPPIEGVDFYQWVKVSANLVKDRVAPADYDSAAAAEGVPEGRWNAINQAWQARITSDWKLGAFYGREYEEAMEG